MPILGVVASSVAKASASFDSIATFTGSGNPSAITFSSIPQTYKHLQFRGRFGTVTSGGSVVIQVNGQTSNYPVHILYGIGTTTTTQANGSITRPGLFVGGFGNTGTSNTWPDSFIVDIADYSSTSKFKTIRVYAGSDRAGTDGAILLSSGLYASTTAITSAVFTETSGYTFTTASSFAMYGIKESA